MIENNGLSGPAVYPAAETSSLKPERDLTDLTDDETDLTPWWRSDVSVQSAFTAPPTFGLVSPPVALREISLTLKPINPRNLEPMDPSFKLLLQRRLNEALEQRKVPGLTKSTRLYLDAEIERIQGRLQGQDADGGEENGKVCLKPFKQEDPVKLEDPATSSSGWWEIRTPFLSAQLGNLETKVKEELREYIEPFFK